MSEIRDAADSEDAVPNHSAIKSALGWIVYLRKQFPFAPPTCVIPVPAGGLIVERRATLSDGREYVCELTFYNDGRAEVTIYIDDRVVELDDIPLRPE